MPLHVTKRSLRNGCAASAARTSFCRQSAIARRRLSRPSSSANGTSPAGSSGVDVPNFSLITPSAYQPQRPMLELASARNSVDRAEALHEMIEPCAIDAAHDRDGVRLGGSGGRELAGPFDAAARIRPFEDAELRAIAADGQRSLLDRVAVAAFGLVEGLQAIAQRAAVRQLQHAEAPAVLQRAVLHARVPLRQCVERADQFPN